MLQSDNATMSNNNKQDSFYLEMLYFILLCSVIHIAEALPPMCGGDYCNKEFAEHGIPADGIWKTLAIMLAIVGVGMITVPVCLCCHRFCKFFFDPSSHPEIHDSHYNRCNSEDEWKSRAINLTNKELIDIEDNIQTKGSISARAAELKIITERIRHEENERNERMKEAELSLKDSSALRYMVIILRDPVNGFGLRYKRNKITFLRDGYPADKTGKIEIGDKILYINGTYIGADVETSEVTSVIRKSQKSVTIIFQRGSVV